MQKGIILMNAYQVEKTHSGSSLTPLETACFEEGFLFIEGEITEATATAFIQNGILLAAKGKPITVILNTNGGDLQAGMNLYDFLTALPDVTTVALKAYSMGAVLFAAGGRRVMLPHSQLMTHGPLISGGVSGSCSSVEAAASVLKAKKAQMAKLLARHTGKTVKELNRILSKDTYFNAEEASAFGLCDTVTTWDKILNKEASYAS
jgi:ATP-dependent Clp protease protease subunit